MANLERKQQKIFAENSQSAQVTAFKTAGGTPLYSKDVDEIQNANFSIGWLEADNAGNVTPYAEDMNGVFYAFTRNLAYLYQKGIPEWSNSETYYQNSMCMYNGVLYQSLVNDNINRQPDTQTDYWEAYASPVSGSVTGVENLGTGAGISTGVSSNKIQLKSLVAGSNITLSEASDSITINSSGGGSSSIAWGNITGSIASQTDLATALSQRGTLSGNNTWTGSNTFGTILPSAATDTLGNSSNYWESVFTSYITSDEGISYIFEDARFEHSRFKVGWNGVSLGIFPEMSSTDNYLSYLGDSTYRWDKLYSVDGNFSGAVTLGSVYTNDLYASNGTAITCHHGLIPIATGASLGGTNNKWTAGWFASCLIGASGINPVDDQKTLGTTNYWKTGYINEVVATSITPKPNETTNIGGSSTRWGSIYATNLNANGTVTFNSISTNGDNTYNIGASGARFAHVWTKNIDYSSTVSTYTEGNNYFISWYNTVASASRTLVFDGNSIYPFQGLVFSFGGVNNYFADIYSLNFHCGTYTTVNSAADGNVLQLSGREITNGNTATLQLSGDFFGPLPSGQVELGNQYRRWTTVYATNGTIDTSDAREKSNIEPLEDALKKINSLGIKTFTYNNIKNCISYGFIAQDELENNPELVFVPEESTKKEEKGVLGVHTNNVIYLAVRAIQELSAKVDSLEQQLKELQK